MSSYKSRAHFIIILSLMLLMLSSIPTFASGKSIAILKHNSPSSISKGNSYKVRGTLKAKKKIKRVKIGIVKSNGKWTGYKYFNNKVNSNSFKVSLANKSLKFNKLKAGSYYYVVCASTNSKGKYQTVLKRKFAIKEESQTPDGFKLSGVSYPSKQIKGKGFYIKGKIKSSKKIKSVTVGVVKNNGSWTSVKVTKKPNSKNFKLTSVDAKLKFGKLSTGDYVYRVNVTTSRGTTTVINHDFSVIDKDSSSNNDEIAESVLVNLEGSSDTSGVINAGIFTATGLNAPSTYNVGAVFNPAGIIQSTETIKRVEAGIVYAPTNKWLAHKYDSSVNSNSFDVSTAASSLSFNTLPAGTFRYRIYVHTDSGAHLLLNHLFNVNPSSKPQDAVNWAVGIANDNSFTYGKVPETSKVGCYFCGTNKKNKPKGYEKTYVCMTFVHAAYAHGAGDSELYNHCKGGKYCLSLNDKIFKEYSCWEKIGLCKDLKAADLLPGDVICWYADDDKSGHLSLYAGDGNIVDAGKVGWGADSIAVRSDAAASYLTKGAKFNSKSFVMRYRY